MQKASLVSTRTVGGIVSTYSACCQRARRRVRQPIMIVAELECSATQEGPRSKSLTDVYASPSTGNLKETLFLAAIPKLHFIKAQGWR